MTGRPAPPRPGPSGQATNVRGASTPAPAPDPTSRAAAASRAAASSATGPATVNGSRTYPSKASVQRPDQVIRATTGRAGMLCAPGRPSASL
ncbi:hypothetical protein ABWK57_37530, partial [Streptomyces sp. NPDC094045]